MSRTKYSLEQKIAALLSLQSNGGDIRAVHLQTGIPERTLYTWQREFPVQPPPTPEYLSIPDEKMPEFANDRDALIYLRRKIMDTANKWLSSPIPARPDKFANHMYVITSLVDIIIKLNDVLGIPETKPAEPEHPVHISLPRWYEMDSETTIDQNDFAIRTAEHQRRQQN